MLLIMTISAVAEKCTYASHNFEILSHVKIENNLPNSHFTLQCGSAFIRAAI